MVFFKGEIWREEPKKNHGFCEGFKFVQDPDIYENMEEAKNLILVKWQIDSVFFLGVRGLCVRNRVKKVVMRTPI